jgi:hypothetical protein
MGRSEMEMILEPNSTPMVVSWSNLNFFSRNWRSMQLFPTPGVITNCTCISDDDELEEVGVVAHGIDL